MAAACIAIVTGRPGSGKSTLASRLADAMSRPLVSRDRIKEETLAIEGIESAADRDLTDRVFKAFFVQIESRARSGESCVAEAAFQHRVWEPKLVRLAEVADVRLVVCSVSTEIAWERRQERARTDPDFALHHPDPPGHKGIDEPYDPPRLSLPTMVVDTTHGYRPTIEEIVAFLS